MEAQAWLGYPSLPNPEVGLHPWLLQSLHLLSSEQNANARGPTSRYHLSSAERAKEVHSLRGWPSLCSADASFWREVLSALNQGYTSDLHGAHCGFMI